MQGDIDTMDTLPEFKPVGIPSMTPADIKAEVIWEAAGRVLERMKEYEGQYALVICSDKEEVITQRYMLCIIERAGGMFDPTGLELTFPTSKYRTIMRPDAQRLGVRLYEDNLSLVADETASLLSEDPAVKPFGSIIADGVWSGTVEVHIGDNEIAAWVTEDVSERLPYLLALDAAHGGRARKLDRFAPLVRTLVMHYRRALAQLSEERDENRQRIEDHRANPSPKYFAELCMSLRGANAALVELQRTIRLLNLDQDKSLADLMAHVDQTSLPLPPIQ